MHVQFAQKAVVVRQGMILLVQKSKEDPHQPGRWELPGGRLKQNESLDEALAREVHEEVGLEIRPGRPLALWSWTLGDQPDSPMVVAVARLCVAVGNIGIAHHDDGDYIEDFAWFKPDAVLALDLIPSAREPIAAALASLFAK